MRREGPGFYVVRFEACWWLHVGKYVVRIGKPWGRGYHRYAWRPIIKVFRCWR